MSQPEEALARIDGLIQIGLRLALSTTSGKIVLATAAANVDRRWIPGPLRPSLGAALDTAAAARPVPLARSEVEEILCEAWRSKRVGDELDALEPEPAAVTLTSQVHRGILDGAPVAVKVLRPGLASAFRQDLTLLDTLTAPLSVAFPELDPGALLAEARERVLDELDLENEAQLMRRFGRALRGGPFVIPTPVTDLCTENVLVSSWLDGRPLAALLDAAGSTDRDAPGATGDSAEADGIAAALIRFVVGGAREGLMHCDLDAADVRLLEDGRIGVLDFGAAVVVDRVRAERGLAVIEAFVADDSVTLDRALTELGVLEAGHGRTTLELARRVLGELGEAEPVRLDADAVLGALRRLEGAEADALELLLAARLFPADLYPARGLGQLVSLIARLGATGVWREQIADALRTGWRA